MTITKHDFEEHLEHAQHACEKLGQEQIDHVTATLLDIDTMLMWTRLREIASWAAEHEAITGDVEQEMLFALGDSWNRHNGGWRDRIGFAQKVCVMHLLTEMLKWKIQSESVGIMIIEIGQHPVEPPSWWSNN